MIGFLRGAIVHKQPPMLLLDVQGVGYDVEAPMSTFYALPDIGQTVQVLTHLVIREDAHILFGFAAEAERRLFRQLIKVNGVGAKLALSILSGMSCQEFAHCICAKDTTKLVRLPGVGKKTAQRLIVEMQDKISVAAEPSAALTPAQCAQTDAVQDAISALQALGYKPQDAVKMVRAVDADLPGDEIIRQALRSVGAAG